MLRVAVPNKGLLAEPAVEMLREAGYRQRKDERDLTVHDADNGVDFFYLRPRDIAVYVGRGQLDAGITGRDMLLDSGAAAEEIFGLDFGASMFQYAAAPGVAASVERLAGRRIATAYTGLVSKHLADHGVDAEVIRLGGAVENAVRLGVADVIADVVSTGATLAAAGLEVVGEPILVSEGVLVRRVAAPVVPGFDQFVRRISGVLTARRYVMMDYDIRIEQVDAACAITPGIESPTVSPLHDAGWVAVRAMVPRADAHRIMDDLWELGARGIIVTDIHACRI